MITYKYKAYNSKHNKKLHHLIDVAGIIWNHSIALHKRYYSLYGKTLTKNKLQKHLAKVRNRTGYWKKVNSQTVQEITERIDKGYKRFFKRKAKRPPTFRKVKDYKSITFKNTGWRLKGNKLRINFLKKEFGFHKSRDYENVKRITIKRNRLGDLWFCFLLNKKPEKYKREGNSSIGIDFGLKTYLTLSNKNKIESPLFFNRYEKDLAALNKALSSKSKGSNNRKKAKDNLIRKYRELVHKRNDYEWKLAHDLCKKYAFISLEDLNISAMKLRWGKKVSDLSFSSFVNKLEQVANKYDTIIQKVDRYYPSSKKCYSCGNKKDDLELSDREYICNKCGVIEDRDINAAKNILSEGIRSYCTKHKTNFNSLELAV